MQSLLGSRGYAADRFKDALRAKCIAGASSKVSASVGHAKVQAGNCIELEVRKPK